MLEFNIGAMIWTLVNLIVLYFLLKKFLFKPVTSMIESRQQEIEHNIAAAEDQRIKAESMLEEYSDKLNNAQHESTALIAKAKQRAEHEYQIILKSAQSNAKRLTEETELQIESDRQAMVAGVRNEVVSLAIMAAAHVSSHARNYDEDQALFESFLSEVGERT